MFSLDSVIIRDFVFLYFFVFNQRKKQYFIIRERIF